MSDSLHGHGVTLMMGNATTRSNMTTVGNVISISGPELSRDTYDISTMDSTAKFREFIPGLLDAGEVTFEVNYDGTSGGTSDFLNDQLTATSDKIDIRFGDDASWSQESYWVCACNVTGLGHAIPFDDKVTQSIKIKLTGQATYFDAGV